MNLIIQFWAFWLLPHKFYGGGGGNRIVEQNNPEQEALAQISDEKWAEYKQRYAPLENEWIGQTNRLDDKNFHDQATGLAANEVKAKYGNQTEQFGASMQGGRLPGANYQSMANDVSQSANKASLGVTDNYLKGLQNVIAIGQGQATKSLQGMGDVAGTSVQGQINDANNSFAAQQAQNGIYGTVAGGAMAGVSNAMGSSRSKK